MAELDGEAKILILDFLKAYERDQEERQDKRRTRWLTISGLSGLALISGAFFFIKELSETTARIKAEDVVGRFIPKTYIEEIHRQTFSGVIDARARLEADKQNFIQAKAEYQKLISDTQALADTVREQKAKLQASATSGAPQSTPPPSIMAPKDMIAAFNISTKEAKCPEGWTIFSEAVGRMIVGAGTASTNRDSNGKLLTGRPSLADDPIGSVGGEEQHILSIAEMPSHSHRVYPHAGNIVGPTGSFPGAGSADPNATSRTNGVTEVQGGNQPHNTMPPFLALVYCRKL
jgi:hypothetical protein